MIPLDVVASADGSLVKDSEGSDVGFHTARQVNLADVLTSPSKVGDSTFCRWSGKHLLAQKTVLKILLYCICITVCFLIFLST